MHHLQPSSATGATTLPAPQAARTAVAPQLLVIGAQDVPDKVQLVLRSLIRLLDGREGLRLQHAEALADCNVVFVGGASVPRLPGRCVTISLVDAGSAPATGLSVVPPLRLSNVHAVLHLAARLLAETPAADAPSDDGLAALFQALSHHLLSRERRVTVLPLLDGRQIIVDFAAERLHTPLSTDELLAGHYRLGEPRRASQDERERVAQATASRLRDLVWRAAQRLGETDARPPALHGRVRLQRWPDAIALSRPGMPRLCAQLTRRALDAQQAAADTDMAPAAVQWFLYAALALGIAAPSDEDAPTAPPSRPGPAPTPSEPRSLLGRLRERLKLW